MIRLSALVRLLGSLSLFVVVGLAQSTPQEAVRKMEQQRAAFVGSDDERSRFFQGQLAPYHALIERAVQQGNAAEALAIAEQTKARFLLDRLQHTPADWSATLTPAEQARQQELRQQYQTATRQLDRERWNAQADYRRVLELHETVERLRTNLLAFEAEMTTRYAALRTPVREVAPFTLEDARGLLPDRQTALLEFVWLAERPLLFVLTKGANGPQVQSFVLPTTSQALSVQVQAWQKQVHRNAYSGGVDPDYHQTLRKLYVALLQPAQTLLTGKTKLVIVPDGVLWRVPFAALMTARNRFLLEDASLVYAPSLTFMRTQRQRRAQAVTSPAPSLLAFGAWPGEATRTHEMETAVRAISQSYPAAQRQLVVGAEATEEKFKAEAGHAHTLLLFAPGVPDARQPLFSYVALAAPTASDQEDGRLEVREVLSQSLRADLVVLPSCQTAGDEARAGEGFIGLSWAFLAAGARNTLATQWESNVSVTKELLTEFHRQLMTKPMRSKAEALRQASLKLLHDEKFYAPYYWANAVLLGDGQ